MSHSGTGGTTHRILECDVSHGGGRMVREGGGGGGGVGVVLARKREVSGWGRGQEVSRCLELRI